MSSEKITQLEQDLKILREENKILRDVISNFFYEYLDVAGRLSKCVQLFGELSSSMNQLTTDFTEHIVDKARDVKSLSDGVAITDILKEVSDHFVSGEDVEVTEVGNTADLFNETPHDEVLEQQHVESVVPNLHNEDYTKLIDWEIRREEFINNHVISKEDPKQIEYWGRVYEEANPRSNTPVMDSIQKSASEETSKPQSLSGLTLNEASKEYSAYLSEVSRDYMELGQHLATSDESYDWSKTKQTEDGRVTVALVEDRHFFRYKDDTHTYLLKSDPVTGSIDIFSSIIVKEDGDLSFMDATTEEVTKIKKNIQRYFLK